VNLPVEQETRGLGAWSVPCLAALAVLFALATGCTPSVGDSCQLSTDCGSTGQLVCDTSEFEGYCTMVECIQGSCPTNSSCIQFYPAIPGCGYNDRVGASRLGESFCMATCSSQSDCRLGYVCATPTESPWFADIVDNNQQILVCLPEPMTGEVPGGMSQNVNPDAAVCQAQGPEFDAGFSSVDASFEASSDGALKGD
jgi:hypothetical protein